MKTRITHRNLTVIWLLLIFLSTLGVMAVNAGLAGLLFSMLLLLMAGWKIQIISDWYMGLREVRMFWRMIIYVWLLVVIALIAIAFVLTPDIT